MANEKSYYTPERIKGDIDYYRAQIIAKSMLEAGMISLAEFNKLTDINLEIFSPLFSEIRQKSLDN